MRWIGCDVHQEYVEVAELDESGGIRRCRVPLPDGLGELQDRVTSATVVLEASGSAFALHDALVGHAARVIVANPAQTRGAGASHVKTDARDSEILARLGASELVTSVWTPPAEIRALRSLVECRLDVVCLRTAIRNRLWAVCYQHLRHHTGKAADAVGYLESQVWPLPHTESVMNSWLRLLQAVEGERKVLTKAVEEWAKASDEARLLQSIPGVGPLLSGVILSQIGDIGRFGTPGKLCAYAGLVPRVWRSGKTHIQGSIGRTGRSVLRSALWQATLMGVRQPGPLKRRFERLAASRPRPVARIACARQMAVLIWHILTRRQPYRIMSATEIQSVTRPITLLLAMAGSSPMFSVLPLL